MQVYITGNDRDVHRAAAELASVGFKPIIQTNRPADPLFRRTELPLVSSADAVLQLGGGPQHAVREEASSAGIPVVRTVRDIVQRFHPAAREGLTIRVPADDALTTR